MRKSRAVFSLTFLSALLAFVIFSEKKPKNTQNMQELYPHIDRKGIGERFGLIENSS